MYQKQILMEKLKEATASVLPISLIVMAISFVLVPVDAGLMLSFVIATAMLILGMGLFTLGADMSMSRIGNYMGSKLTKSRKLPLILTVSSPSASPSRWRSRICRCSRATCRRSTQRC